jgi:uncharacterized membrane protein
MGVYWSLFGAVYHWGDTMGLFTEPYIIAAVAALTIGNYLGRRKLRPGWAAFAMFMAYGLVLCSVGTPGRLPLAPFWIGPMLGLVVTPFLYGVWVLAQPRGDR